MKYRTHLICFRDREHSTLGNSQGNENWRSKGTVRIAISEKCNFLIFFFFIQIFIYPGNDFGFRQFTIPLQPFSILWLQMFDFSS